MQRGMQSEPKRVSNLELPGDGTVIVTVNPKVCPLDIVYAVAYVFLDRSHVVVGGDPQSMVTVELTPKDNAKDPEELGREFGSELISYAVYAFHRERSKELIDAILKRCLPECQNRLDDPDGIAIPWEEKYG